MPDRKELNVIPGVLAWALGSMELAFAKGEDGKRCRVFFCCFHFCRFVWFGLSFLRRSGVGHSVLDVLNLRCLLEHFNWKS